MSAHESEYSEEEMESEQDKEFGLSIISLVGPSNHDCGYCKGKDTSISFGIWAHSLSCNVKIIIVHKELSFLETIFC